MNPKELVGDRAQAVPRTSRGSVDRDLEFDSLLEDFLRVQAEGLLRYVDRLLPPDVREWHEPMDVLQDVFLDAFCHAQDFPIADEPEARRWLMTIARHRIVDLGRQRRSQKRGGGIGRIPLGSVVALLENLAVYSRTPSRSAAAHEFVHVLDDALSRIEANYAQAIRLRYVQGLSCKEAGKKMSCSDKAIQAMCVRGLDALRLEMPSASVFA
jgi:RNA polymerase sigma-70 factor (ECF subfamily)